MLETRSNSRTSRVVEEVFRRVAVGIQGNPGFTPQALLVFVFEVLSNSIPQLAARPKLVNYCNFAGQAGVRVTQHFSAHVQSYK